MLSFKPAFSLSSFNLVKRLFISFSLRAIRVVSSAYLRLLVFLLAILIPACNSSSLAFCMMYSAYKLNKQGDNVYSHDVLLFQFWIHSLSDSWPAYGLPRRQVRWSGIPIALRIFHSLLWSTIKSKKDQLRFQEKAALKWDLEWWWQVETGRKNISNRDNNV